MDGVFGVDCLSHFAVSLVVALLQRKLSRWYAHVTNIFVRDGINSSADFDSMWVSLFSLSIRWEGEEMQKTEE